MKKRLLFLTSIFYILFNNVVYADKFASCGGIKGIPSAIPALIRFFIIFVKILVPIFLIIFASVEIAKFIISKDADFDELRKKVMPKFIAAVVVFFVVTLVQLLFKTMGNLPMQECINCFINDNNACEYYEKNMKKDYSEEVKKAAEEREKQAKKRSQQEEENRRKAEEEQKRRGVNILGTMDIANSKDLVGIFYTTWHRPDQSKVRIITQQSSFCEGGVDYYWGKPALGYYSSDDKNVIRTHMKQLAEAQVDFIIIDWTNMNPRAGFTHGSGGWNRHVDSPMKAILETILDMRKSGEKTPYVLPWVWTGNEGGYNQFEGWNSVNAIYDDFYKDSKYSDIWVYWGGKPFFITTSPTPDTKERDIVTRSMWGLNGVDRYDWTYLEINNDKPAKDKSGNVEQIGVSTAMQQSYMSDSSAICRRNGETFYNQWKTAFKYHPKVVTITWWNEWTAMCLNGGTFTDEYSQECSRDIEPMSGGHGTRYYDMMKEYIAAYKGNKSCPHLTER